MSVLADGRQVQEHVQALEARFGGFKDGDKKLKRVFNLAVFGFPSKKRKNKLGFLFFLAREIEGVGGWSIYMEALLGLVEAHGRKPVSKSLTSVKSLGRRQLD